MTKRLFSLVTLITFAMAALADNVTITSNQAITFNDATSPNQGVYLHAGTATFSVDGTHVEYTSGMFSGTSTGWTLSKVLTCSAGCSLPTIGNISADSESGPDGTLAFNYSRAGTLHIVYGATSVTAGKFYIMQKGSEADAYTSFYGEDMAGIPYSGPFGTRTADYYFTKAEEAVVSLTGSGTVYFGGTAPYCIYAILYVPEEIPIYGTYDFQGWASNTENITGNTTATIGLDANNVMTGVFTGDNVVEGKTMTLNDAFTLIVASGKNVSLRKNSTDNTGLFAQSGHSATFSINGLKAGDWFTIKKNSAGFLTFSGSNNVHKYGSSTVSEGDAIESETKYIIEQTGTVNMTFGGSANSYIYSI